MGKTLIGSEYPVAKQTMTTTNTRDVSSSVDQVIDTCCTVIDHCIVCFAYHIYTMGNYYSSVDDGVISVTVTMLIMIMMIIVVMMMMMMMMM